MPNYVQSPFKPMPQYLIPGTPSYVWGSFNDKTGPTVGKVISNSAVTTTGTLTFQILGGNIPIITAGGISAPLITVVGCANSVNFNVTNVALLSVSTTSSGVCTVTYTISSTTQGTLADGGTVIIPQPEVAENITTTGASVPVAVAAASGLNGNGKSLSVSLTLPNAGTLSGVTAVIQGANFDVDSAYQTIGTIGTSLAANSVTEWQSGQGVPTAPSNVLNVGNVVQLNFRFYRVNLTAVTGSGPVVVKILQ